MAVIEYDSYKQKLLAMDETFENLFKALEIEQARQELNRLELEAHEDGFWNDLERSQKNQMHRWRVPRSSKAVNGPQLLTRDQDVQTRLKSGIPAKIRKYLWIFRSSNA